MGGMKLATLLVLAAALAAAETAVGGVAPAPVVRFEPAWAEAGQFVSVQLTGAPRGNRKPVRLYLYRRGVGAEPRSRLDPRLHFLGLVAPDTRGRGALGVRMPPLGTGTYSVAVSCPGCAGPRGSGVSVPSGTSVRVVTPTPGLTAARRRRRAGWAGRGRGCTATGSSRSSSAPTERTWASENRTVRSPTSSAGSHERVSTGRLAWTGQRLDAPSPPMRVLAVTWGYSSAGKGSWASAVVFPSEGCWRLTGRVEDVSLTYVVRVVGA